MVKMSFDEFEDNIILEKQKNKKENKYSPYCDFIYYESSRTPGLMLAARILKPKKPSYIVVGTHGWHMSIKEFIHMDEPMEDNNYLKIQVDMRGRAHSDGEADCNGWELFDVIDAVNYAREHYSEYIIDPDIVYFESGSGGGGNGLAIVNKFPDFFTAATAFCGISDYALWYEEDEIGEFQDEMDVWIGCKPSENPMAYQARSGLDLIENLHTPLYLAHGETDIRVPVVHSRQFKEKADEIGKGDLVQFDELAGVGTRSHWGNATEDQLQMRVDASEKNRKLHRQPIELKSSGRLIVGGYLFTKHFSVVLDSIDKVAVLDYDLKQNRFTVSSEEPCDYTIQRKGV